MSLVSKSLFIPTKSHKKSRRKKTYKRTRKDSDWITDGLSEILSQMEKEDSDCPPRTRKNPFVKPQRKHTEDNVNNFRNLYDSYSPLHQRFDKSDKLTSSIHKMSNFTEFSQY